MGDIERFMAPKGDPAPTLEYTCSVCTCGRELSSLYYRITAAEQYKEFAEAFGLPMMESYFTTLEAVSEIEDKISFCCRMNMQYGIRAPISSAVKGDQSLKSSSDYKFPISLAGPLSREKILTWY
jgi:hypothetical protein